MKENKKRKGTVKKVLVGFFVAVLLVGVTIVGTLAFMSAISNEKNNSFVGSAGIQLALAETKFDSTSSKLYGPGDVIEKNPQLINYSNEARDGDVNANQEEWVALMVKYSINNSAATYDNMKGIIKDINFNDDSWMQINNSNSSTKYAIYLYNKTIKRNENTTEGVTSQTVTADQITKSTSGSYTEPLFEEIEVISQTGTETVGNYTTSTLPAFNIDVIGYAIKAEYVNTGGTLVTSYSDLTEAQKTELKNNLRSLLEAKLTDAYKVAE